MIYDALWRVGQVTPRQADALAIWEIAVMLGASEELTPPEEEKPTKKTSGRRTRTSKHESESKRLIRERLAHARGQGPKPEATVSNAGALAMMGNMRRR